MDYPEWLRSLNLMGTTAVSVTFTLVLIFLNPMMVIQGAVWNVMYVQDMFHFHLLNPVLAVIALIISSEGYRYSRKLRIAALAPVLIYSLVYLTNVVFLGTWEDFYNFTFGGKMWMVPVAIVFMYALSMLLTKLLVRLCEKKKN